jgi:hypothetical protein
VQLKILAAMNVMNIDNIPEPMKRVMGDKSLSMSQKMVTFMAFMPTLPNDPKVEQYCKDNLEVGTTIKQLIADNKILLGKFDKNFKLDVICN